MNERCYASIIVKPDGWAIPDESARVHGITTALATEVGLPAVFAAATFSQFVKLADVVVGHNIAFDVKMMQCEFYRLGRQFPPFTTRCTKEMAEPVLRLPPTERMVAAGYGNKFKPPTLTECFDFLFNEELPGAHDALVDARASVRVYFELTKESGVKLWGDQSIRHPTVQMSLLLCPPDEIYK
jgi:DNA polymerase-3 subunit epsilon